nr:DUF4625 domain-containing protein [uncultured Carboxylicivirga sp.]
MLKVLRNLIVLAMGLLLLEACGKEDIADTTAPEAFITAPVANTKYYRGNTLYLNAVFTDDTALKECAVYLTPQQSKNAKGWDSPWKPDDHIFPLSGKEDKLENKYLFEPTIPLNIMSGEYKLVIVTSDQSLNYSQTEIPIYIQ